MLKYVRQINIKCQLMVKNIFKKISIIIIIQHSHTNTEAYL